LADSAVTKGITTGSHRVLDPIDRISEVWFGLIIVLTFTCSISVKNAGREEVMEMILAAFGCNVAWGILDGFMYLQASFTRRARSIASLRAVHLAADRESAHQQIVHAMPPLIAGVMSEAELDAIRSRLIDLPEVQARPSLSPREWLGGLGVFLAVFLSTFPVAVPFLFTTDARLALRISNGIALLMLFLTGYGHIEAKVDREQVAKLGSEERLIPAGLLSQFIVGQHVRPDLIVSKVFETNRGNILNTQ
jgi:VIT1/CCC1 family predicted Fe2+/Mn2+ transporter